jgi:hypothetical protein
MKRTIGIYDPSVPLVFPQHGMANVAFNVWIKQVTERGLLIGSGSPEGVVEAQQGVEYLDEEGTDGEVKYIKQKAQVAGDRTQGWVLIGPTGASLPDQTGESGKYLTTDGADASWAALAGGGDMAAATYDPGAVGDDAFDMDNMVDGSTNKVMTATQETNFETAYSHSQAAHGDADADNTASNETSHANVLETTDVDDTPVNGVTDAPVSSNWAYDHANTHAPTDADNTASNETSHADVLVDGDIGTGAGTVCAGDDSRLSDSRTPTSHNTSHENGGSDEISVAGLSGVLADDQHVIDSEVESVITAELAGGQSIDNAIDSLVATHATDGDAHHNESHTVASHSDTDATGAELNELTDGSETTLHSHAGGGSTKEYASFYLSTGGVTGVSTTETTLTLNATSLNSNGSVFSLSSSQVTVNKDGDFEISAQCYFNTAGSSRSEFTMFLEVDGVEVPGTRTGTYQRGYDSGDTASFSIMLEVTSGEVFQLRIIRTDGSATTGYQDDNGTRLNFKEL